MRQVSTISMSYDEWLAKRNESIGASECGAILGLNPWKTPVDVWLEKTADKPTSLEDNLNMRLGRDLEPVIQKLFEEETGFKVRRDNKIRIDDEYDFITTNLDGMVIGEKVPVEYKTMSKWDGEIPDYYFAQIQHQMMVTNSSHCYFAVLVLGFNKQFIVEKYNRDDSFIYKMRRELVHFWNENVKMNIAPEVTSVEDCKKIYKDVDPDSILEADDVIFGMLADMDFYRYMKQKYEMKFKAMQKDVMVQMGAKESVEYNGISFASWKQSKNSLKFDSKAFKQDHPNLHLTYCKEVAGSRRFNLKKIKDHENEQE